MKLSFWRDVGCLALVTLGLATSSPPKPAADFANPERAGFDVPWNWSPTLNYHNDPNHPAFGYFSWSLKTSGIAHDEMAAPDGEECYAQGLRFAAHCWRNRSGIHDHQAVANRRLYLPALLHCSGEFRAGIAP